MARPRTPSPSPPDSAGTLWYEGSLTPPYEDLPIIATDELGMIIHEDAAPTQTTAKVRAVKEKKPRAKRQPIQNVSKHFNPDNVQAADGAKPKARNPTRTKRAPVNAEVGTDALATPPRTPAASVQHLPEPQPQPRIYYGLNVDDLSSDSSLTDVPSEIGPDPFSPPLTASLVVVKTPKKSRHPKTSPYFPTPHRARPTFLSTLPFPPISQPTFGLMQERLSTQPFKLLLATIFLNKTPGERAMPVCYQLLQQYPTPQDLASAEPSDITTIIRHLGFQNQRAHKIVGLAKGWVERPPQRGIRYRKTDYPMKGDGRNVKPDEALSDEADCTDDTRVAWEISHLPGLGPYSHDSWRMFCRDRLRGVAEGYNGEAAAEGEVPFEPEWKRTLPKDKELRAWMTWMWMKEGWIWDCETGKRKRASEELMALARGGGVVVEEHTEEKGEVLRLEGRYGSSNADAAGEQETAVALPAPQRPAGDILDEVKAESIAG